MLSAPYEDDESVETPRPGLLDVVKVDGRWAQVISGGHRIRYLGDKTSTPINWDNFSLRTSWNMSVSLVRELRGEDYIPLALIDSIHWGPEQRENPSLRQQVTVFGEFEANNLW